jgi:hypothetical protein
MLSLDEARALLGDDAPESDAAVAELCALVEGLAEAVIDSLSTAPERGEQEAS